MISRREAVQKAALAAAVVMAAQVTAVRGQSAPAPAGPYHLDPLPYAFDALEPHIDAQTMQIHHDRHHAAYVANLNKAVADTPDLAKKSPAELQNDRAGGGAT